MTRTISFFLSNSITYFNFNFKIIFLNFIVLSFSWLGGAENGKHSSATAEIADGWRQYPGGLSRGYGAIMMGCKAAGDAKLAETYFSQMMQDEESPTASSLSTSISAMGWQTSGVDERAVKAVLPLLRSTVGIEKYQSLCNIHEPTLTRIGTIFV